MQKRLLRDSIVPYTCYYTTTVFAPAVCLDISRAVENTASEAAIQVCTAGMDTNWTSRENDQEKTSWDSNNNKMEQRRE